MRKESKEFLLKEVAYEIINVFEKMLEENDITIPDIYREGNEGEARIFGDTFYNMEQEIEDILKKSKIIKPFREKGRKNE